MVAVKHLGVVAWGSGRIGEYDPPGGFDVGAVFVSINDMHQFRVGR